VRKAATSISLAALLGVACSPPYDNPGNPPVLDMTVSAADVGCGVSCVIPDASTPDLGYTPPDLTATLKRLAMDAATFTASVPNNPWKYDIVFAVEYLPTGQRWNYGGDIPHGSASSFKWIWTAAALAAGKTPSQVVACAHPTFQYSCNNTSGVIIDMAGGVPAVNTFIQNVLGNDKNSMTLCHWNYDVTRVDPNCGNAICNYVPANSPSCSAGFVDNYYTPNAGLNFLRHVYRKDIGLSPDRAQALLDWSTWTARSGYGGWIGTQLPPAVQKTIHHKPGAIAPCCGDAAYSWINELAIVESPVGPYGVSIMSGHANDWHQEVATLEWSSCVIYHALTQDVPDPFASSACTHNPSAHPESWTEIPECCPPSRDWGGGTGVANCSATCVQ
jgi:beta-lactamase class A